MEYDPKKSTLEQVVGSDEEQNKPILFDSVDQKHSEEYPINTAARRLYCKEVPICWKTDLHAFVNGD